jgi:Holliday junction resolvasome RuvABC DNA-binding subunit
MDREMQLRHLEQAERHIAQGERHIAEQEERIAALVRLGADTTEAQKLLNNFFATQMQHIQHRERILKELEE